MTWGMHAIGHLELGQEDEASELFNRSYLPYVQVRIFFCQIVLFFLQSQPSPRSTCGLRCQEVEGRSTSSRGWEGSYRQRSFLRKAVQTCHNQALLHGYLGVRVRLDRLEVIDLV